MIERLSCFEPIDELYFGTVTSFCKINEYIIFTLRNTVVITAWAQNLQSIKIFDYQTESVYIAAVYIAALS